MRTMTLDKKPNYSRVSAKTEVERSRIRFVSELFNYVWKHSKKSHKIINTPWGTLILVRKK